jgi:hypothetical protein
VTSEERHPGDLLVRIGAGVFVVGIVATLIVLVPFVSGSGRAPVGVDFAMLALPGGFGLALLGLLRGARASHE